MEHIKYVYRSLTLVLVALLFLGAGCSGESTENEISIVLSPFIQDKTVATITNESNGASAALVGDRDSDGFLTSLEHVRIVGLGVDGIAKPEGENAFSFIANDGYELAVQTDVSGEVTGVYFRENTSAEPVIVGIPPMGFSAFTKTDTSIASDSERIRMPRDTSGSILNVAITKCRDEQPQFEERVVRAEFRLDGVINGRDVLDSATGSLQKTGNIYSGRLIDWRQTWTGTGNGFIESVAQGIKNTLDGVCGAIGNMPVPNGTALVAGNVGICIQASALIGSTVIGAPFGGVFVAACSSAVVGLTATCDILNAGGPGLSEAIDRGIRNIPSTATLSVENTLVENFGILDSKTISVALSSNGPIDISLHGGPVDTVTTITSSPNPSGVNEPVSVMVNVSDVDGVCVVDGNLGILENTDVLKINNEFNRFDAIGRSFNSEQEVRYQATFSGDDRYFNDSFARLYTHVVSDSQLEPDITPDPSDSVEPSSCGDRSCVAYSCDGVEICGIPLADGQCFSELTCPSGS